MTVKFFENNDKVISGITLFNENKIENNNMALHSCVSTEHVLQNRQALAEHLKIPLQRFVCANQTHSANFFKVTEQHIGRGATDAASAIPDTDALFTFEKEVVLCSFTADCVPVLFYDTETSLIGAIHSGWQGTVKEISNKLLQHLKTEEKIDLTNLQVWIGPALSQEKFEVDEDVYEKFKALGYADSFIYYKEETKKYHIDNQLTVQKQLELSGVPTENIQIDRTCTFISKEGFSYRENRSCGRHVSFIYSQK